MALPMAYGDSRSYFQFPLGVADAVSRDIAVYNNQIASMGNQYQQAKMGYNSHLSQMQAYLPREAVSAKRSNKVVGDCGFGGADSRPRSRRFVKTPTTASSPPPQS